MPRTHPPDPPGFRAEAVRLARGSPAQATDLGGAPRRCGIGCGRRMLTTAGASPATGRRMRGGSCGGLLPLATLCHVLAVDRSVYYAWAALSDDWADGNVPTN